MKNLLQTDKSKIIVKEICIDIQSIDDEDDKEYMNDREGVSTVNASSIGVTKVKFQEGKKKRILKHKPH